MKNWDLLNETYQEVNISVLEEIQIIKRPTKFEFDACRLLCLFLNSFKEQDKKWPRESFSTWVTVHHYLVANPTLDKTLKDI